MSFINKSVKSKIPLCFKDQSVPTISFTYIASIEAKIFNYKNVLHDLSIGDFKSANPP